MDILYDFHPFVFGGVGEKGRYSASLPLKTPSAGLLATHGRLFGIFCLQYPEFFPLDTIAKEILPHMEELYYERECSSPHAHLVQSLTETQGYLEKRILEVNGVDSVDFGLVVGCVWGSVLYLARCGGMCALRLYREDTFGILFETNNTSGSSGVVSLSGFVKEHDVVVMHDNTVDTSRFPVSTSSLNEVDSQVVYTKLTHMFDVASVGIQSGSISGFYIDAERVPSVEDERITFADVRNERDLHTVVPKEEETALEEESGIEQHSQSEAPSIFRNVLSGPASLRTFGSKAFSQLHLSNSGVLARIKKILSFFTHKRMLVMGCMFLVLFGGFILLGKDYENAFKQEKKTDVLKQELVPKIEEAFKQGQYYAELNPDRAKKYLQEAKEYISQFGEAASSDADIMKLSQSVQEAYAIVTKTYTLDTLTPFFDLTTVNQQASGSKIAISDNSLIVSDTAQGVVYKVGEENRSAAPVMGQEDVSGLISAEGDGAIVYGISSRGIFRTQQNDSTVVKLKDSGSEWGEVVDMQVFGGSVYLLDRGRNQVWKYVPEGNGFGSLRNYISSESEVNLSAAVSLAIDGNVWIGLGQGEVAKFYSGKRDVFSLASIDQPLSVIKAVYTDENTDYLYVLDDTNGRVVVYLKKDGSYVSTYESGQFKGAADVVVDTKQNQLYVLNKSSIYRVETREKNTPSE